MRINVAQANVFPKMSLDKMKAATKVRIDQIMTHAKGRQKSNMDRVVTYTGTHSSSVIKEISNVCKQLIDAGHAKKANISGSQFGIDPIMDSAAPDVSNAVYAIEIAGEVVVAVQEYRFGSGVAECSYIVSVKL